MCRYFDDFYLVLIVFGEAILSEGSTHSVDYIHNPNG